MAFNKCLFSRYLAISLILVVFLLITSYLIDKTISKPLIVSLFVLIIVYGYYFDRSTESIIESSFLEKEAKGAFKELSENLKQEVSKQTRDITQKNIQLEKLLKAQSEFLDIASHQLRTPVSVIRGTISMIQDGDIQRLPKHKQAQFISNAAQKGAKLDLIINDILAASELDSQKFTIDSKTPKINLENVVDQAVKDFKLEAEQRKIDLLWKLPKVSLPQVVGDASMLEQAVSNFISNALRYTPSTKMVKEARTRRKAKGLVKVEIKQIKDDLVVSVSDNGIGIPKDEAKKLFHKFTRASNATAMYTDGSGLGLFIVKEIIDGHKGRVWLESTESKGSIFYFSLPVGQPVG
ncbi:MAG: HAMP domain-containing sensor histidine kinase [bacterium]